MSVVFTAAIVTMIVLRMTRADLHAPSYRQYSQFNQRLGVNDMTSPAHQDPCSLIQDLRDITWKDLNKAPLCFCKHRLIVCKLAPWDSLVTYHSFSAVFLIQSMKMLSLLEIMRPRSPLPSPETRNSLARIRYHLMYITYLGPRYC